MNVLVTGANGFLGRFVVAALLEQGHGVRALVRPAARVEGLWPDSVEVARADLRAQAPDGEAFAGVGAVVHLAATVRGDEGDALATSVAGTERLLDALASSDARRLVLASSIAVYDWHAAAGALTEETPLTTDFDRRGAYALTKSWQERVVRRAAERHGLELVVLRPGFIWGPGAEWVDGVGQRLGGVLLVPGPARDLPLTYVENCADAFARAVTAGTGETLDVFDDERVSAWRYAQEWNRRSGAGTRLVPVPYAGAAALTRLAALANRVLFGGRGKLPSVLDAPRFEARFKPLRFPNARLRAALQPSQPWSFETALARTFGSPGTEYAS